MNDLQGAQLLHPRGAPGINYWLIRDSEDGLTITGPLPAEEVLLRLEQQPSTPLNRLPGTGSFAGEPRDAVVILRGEIVGREDVSAPDQSESDIWHSDETPYCKVCHKTHGAVRGEKMCGGPGSWTPDR